MAGRADNLSTSKVIGLEISNIDGNTPPVLAEKEAEKQPQNKYGRKSDEPSIDGNKKQLTKKGSNVEIPKQKDDKAQEEDVDDGIQKKLGNKRTKTIAKTSSAASLKIFIGDIFKKTMKRLPKLTKKKGFSSGTFS